MYDGCPDGRWRLSAHNSDMDETSEGQVDLPDLYLNQPELDPNLIGFKRLSEAIRIAKLKPPRPDNWIIGR